MGWIYLFTLGLLIFNVANCEESMEFMDDIDDLDEVDELFLRQLEMKETFEGNENQVLNGDLGQMNTNDMKPLIEVDPCEKIYCGAGQVCQLNDDEPSCVCVQECPEEIDSRRYVCTNKNETWPSDCSVYQQRCLCDIKSAECKDPENIHLHIDYYGSCHEIKTCSDEEINDFPRRMRDWLFNVMRDLAERDELTEHYMQMELEAETNMTRRWANAAVWKWCDLDEDTDRSVSRHELFPIRAPLVSLEHCIAPFLESCDANNDHRITLAEWGSCLGLEEMDLNERCENIKKSLPNAHG